MIKDIASLIIKHTIPTRSHLTPELALRLITPSCVLWRASEEESPFKDPFWAFYWPGGQATARYLKSCYYFCKELPAARDYDTTAVYILDNGDSLIKNRCILDVGCGCGAGAIAAFMMKAKHVVANDIDPYAIIATKLNAEINKVSIETSTSNFIGTKCDNFDTILVGDMFYNEEFANILFGWLRILNENGKTVLIGDPGRHGLTEKRRDHMTMLAKYQMLPETCEENHGFTHTTLWKLI